MELVMGVGSSGFSVGDLRAPVQLWKRTLKDAEVCSALRPATKRPVKKCLSNSTRRLKNASSASASNIFPIHSQPLGGSTQICPEG